MVVAFLVVDEDFFFVVVPFLAVPAVCELDAAVVVVIVSFLAAHEVKNPAATRTVTEVISICFIGCS